MSGLLARDDCLLLVVDVQERLAPAIADGDAVVERCRLLAAVARRLGVPTLVSEQYPRGLGATVARLGEVLGATPRLAKLAFDCAAEEALRSAVAATGRGTLVLVGMETHVCVLQTALGFRARGADVAVVADAVGSRRQASHRLGLERMRAEGCRVVDSEMVAFEWLGRAGTDEFRALAPWLRDGRVP